MAIENTTLSGSSVGGYMARETTIGKLPADATIDWYEMDVTAWGETGAKTNTEREKQQNVSRQYGNSTIVGFDYAAAYNNKMRPSNNRMALESFLFAAPNARPAAKVSLAAGDATITLTGTVAYLNVTAYTFTAANGFIPGNWIAVGSDTATKRFGKQFYAEIVAVTSKRLTFGRTSQTLTADAGTGKSIEIFMGLLYRNEKEVADIVCTSFTIKRLLGIIDGNQEAQNIEGCIGNSLKLSMGTEKPFAVDMSYMAICDMDIEDDSQLTTGTIVPKEIEDAFNTSSDMYQSMITVFNDDGTVAGEQLFGIVTNSELELNNNMKAAKGHTREGGKVKAGGHNLTPGPLDVTGKIDLFFNTIKTIALIKRGAPVGYHAIAARNNKGIVVDMPNFRMSDGMVNVPAEEEVTIPITAEAGEGRLGSTVGFIYFDELPNSLMPSMDCN